ncbi:MAG: nitroreductase family protein [Clostridia bacterium]|nr:nitroreductase family protein [Clostridia bacterium]
MINMVLDAMLKRSSIRGYKPEKLTEKELAVLKKAALSSPTAMNRQDQRFVFATDAALIERLDNEIMEGIVRSGNVEFAERMKARGGKPTYGAPLVVVICSRPAHFSRVDAGIAVENIALAAKSIGLDSVILGMPEGAFSGEEGRAMRELFRFPEGFEFSIAISVGRRATDKEPHEWNEDHVIMI